MGWPILGDPIYGAARRGGPALHLHAREIVVPLYRDRDPIRVEAPVPAAMLPAVRTCGVTPPQTVGPASADPEPSRQATASVDARSAAPGADGEPGGARAREPRRPPPSRWSR